MLHLKLFGETRVIDADGHDAAVDVGGAKPRQILAILALSPGPVSKDRLADLLWDEQPPRSYLGTLESYVCVLRRGLGQGQDGARAIRTVSHGYVLDPEVVSTDATRFRALTRAAAAESAPRAALELLQQAIGLVEGELLVSEPYAGWATHERERFALDLAAAATAAARLALTVGDLEEAVRTARLALDQDPLGEDACRTLMRALHASGRRCEALKPYLRLREALATELGASPSTETRELYLSLLRDDEPQPHRDPDGHDEVIALLDLLRQAVGGMPTRVQGSLARAIDEVAAGIALAG